MKIIGFFLLIGFGLISCTLSAQDKVSIKTIKIDPIKHLSYGAFFKSLTLNSPDCSIEYLDGFDFEWGNEYQLKLKEITLAEPPMDGSSIEFELIKVISKMPVAEDFEFKLSIESEVYLGYGDDQISSLELQPDSNYLYLEQVLIELDAERREEFETVLKTTVRKVGWFEITDGKSIRFLRWN